MLNSHYQSELNQLRRLADEFARRNPALAPLLGVDSANDPDVERLLEGVAFLTGMVRQRLDDEFPEFIQELAQLLYPHYLQPLPCLTLLQFQPRTALQEVTRIEPGCEIASVPVDGQRVRFSSTAAVTWNRCNCSAAAGTAAPVKSAAWSWTSLLPPPTRIAGWPTACVSIWGMAWSMAPSYCVCCSSTCARFASLRKSSP